ncbi:MAG: hypothetical protein LBD86_00225 [Spirochaetaceae bacterium]|jgi:hypothetical protein|nr:hypothetical protein [Spirochaetaceae bacterium]
MNQNKNRFVFSLLLGLILAGPAYGDLSVTGEAGFYNIGGANDGKTRPYINYTADAQAYTFFGPGTIGVALELQFVIDPGEATSNGNNLGDNFLSVFYTWQTGPGEFTAALDQSTAFSYWNLEPSLEYGGITTGFADLGLGLWYNHKFSRNVALTSGGLENTASGNNGALLSLGHPHPDGYDEGGGEDGGSGNGGGSSGGAAVSAIYGGGGPYSDKVGFYVSAAFDFGLNVQYGFACGFNKNVSGGPRLEISELVYLDLNYSINDRLQTGLEIDDTGKYFSGFTFNPYLIFHATDSTTVGLNLYLRKINSPAARPEFGPSIRVMYTF